MISNHKLNKTSVLLVIILFIIRCGIAPVFSLISDCDETYNYLDPLNFLLRGFGKETWEYSPVYSIRSWAFLLPFYSILKPLSAIGLLPSDLLFFSLRFVLGAFSALSEIYLFKQLLTTFNLTQANWWLFLQIFNPGWFHACVELLPSSFAMILLLLSTGHFLKYLSTKSTVSFINSLIFVFIAGILGWPFVLLIAVPLVLQYVVSKHKCFFTNVFKTGVKSLIGLFLIIFIVLTIDSIIYGKITPVFYNIVSYNVLQANEETGPNIFGVEPWYYYVLNLVLNFPILTLLGVVGFSLLVPFDHNLIQILPIFSQLFIWIGVFISQPHKEERFLYPIYGLITFTASLFYTKIFQNNATTMQSNNRLQLTIKSFVKLFSITAIIIQSLLRIYALINNYTAPIGVYFHLFDIQDILTEYKTNNTDNSLINVCVGREWYHFPTSLLLPDNFRIRYVPSGFDGLLPGDFNEKVDKLTSIRSIPPGMNNANRFDAGKIFDHKDCDLYVDISSTIGEKDIFNPQNMNAIYCEKFIDIENSKLLGRAFTLPTPITDLPTVAKNLNKIYHVEYKDYCVYSLL
ncbi:related to Alpha-1,2-mannosyltransferase ALG9 [Saccharomycodes ludwigii]|uniref:Mannosyltransferase n=1 Tax=Saccharomycodes ludwigii TaxID=36035 RepID=A0A376BC30_9ASCO|nr:hypothetical protein SCDLUD_003021 [Saccharomycodes ludwigii]KAH3901525.1 hypothetical protein SCDLUD_003021 [Saccharomycodes ludwigii]SSD62159.1 related to Alpha-1,2-mannosyltransferase ALG9 [Saccharomycodes ludwigii]